MIRTKSATKPTTKPKETMATRKRNALTSFTSKIAYPHIKDVLNKTAWEFYKNKDNMREDYLNAIKHTFTATKKFSNQTNQKIGYISLTLLRTNLLYGKLVYDVHVYGKRLYLHDYVKVDEIDASIFFKYLEEAKQYLYSERRKYVGKINASQVDNIISEHFQAFGYLFNKMFRYVLLEATECNEYAEIAKSDKFRIITGELIESPVLLHVEAVNRLSFNQLNERIAGDDNCNFLDARNSSFANTSMANADLRYSDFRGSSLKAVDFSNALLEGCIFANCNLANANLIETELMEANFQNADLRRANLSGAVSAEGIFEDEDWISLCKLPLNLNGADLREATIENAILQGVDFTCAKVDGAIFTNTDLSKCKFDMEQLSHIDLSDEQKSQITII